jgi:competence protein ComEC
MSQISKRDIILLFILITIAIARLLFFNNEKINYENIANRNIRLEGVISEEPEIRFKNKHLVLDIKELDIKVLVIDSLYSSFSYGDKVEVTGKAIEPESFETISGREFDYKRYLINKDIYLILRNPKIELISQNEGSLLKSVLYKFRNSFISNIKRFILPPKSDLASGLVLGVDGGFSPVMKDKFIETGTIHIVALSGYNITIVANWIMNLFKSFPIRVSSSLGILSIILFVIMSGTSSTAVRAGIMASIVLFARMTGRSYQAGRSLVVAFLVMITFDPRVVFDMSFLLSFFATFGVIFITPKITKYFYFIPTRFGLREISTTTVSATVAVLPVILYSTGIFSIVSFFTNLLILPLIPVTMILIFVTGIAGYIWGPLLFFFSFISHIFLNYIIFIIEIFSKLPFASFVIPKFSIIFVIIAYVIIFYFVFRKKES